MFQGMFRKRGRPPEPPLQIGGYDEPNQNESIQIPGHQLRNAPRQLPLPAVREFDQVEVAQQEQPGFNQAIVDKFRQQRQIDVVRFTSSTLDPYQSTGYEPKSGNFQHVIGSGHV